MQETYLITGSVGFIGSNFIRYMLNRYAHAKFVGIDILKYADNLANFYDFVDDERYVFLQGDICDETFLKDVFHRFQPDYVVNFAAETNVDKSFIDSKPFYKTNIYGTLTLLNTAYASWVDSKKIDKCKFIQVSTDEVYGSLELDDTEKLFCETTKINPHNPYALSKAAADLIALSYFDMYNLPVIVTRCSNNYGPFQSVDKFIPKMINNAICHQKLGIYGDGSNVRDWIYVKDHCRAIDLIINEGTNVEIYNIGASNELSNNYVVQRIIEKCASKTNDGEITMNLITYIDDRKNHDVRYGIDYSKLSKQLEWRPGTEFSVGLSNTIDWYIKASTLKR